MKKYLYLILLVFLSSSCNSQEKKSVTNNNNTTSHNEVALQIGEYVTSAFEDSKGNLWFGTIQKGIAKYDGNKLKYYTTKDGLPSNRVTGVIEGSNGAFWLKTGKGLSKIDGEKFINFSVNDDFFCNSISQLFIDSKGTFWVGTWGGAYKFNGTQFEKFPIPYPKVGTKINQDTKNWITAITEDSQGNIWFGRDGYGASKFNGKSFIHFTIKEGLNSNYVQSVIEDNEGNIWIGTRVPEKDNADINKRTGEGGLNKFDGDKFVHFSKTKGLHKADVFETYKDSSNNIWVSTTHNGIYKYNGSTFLNYDVPAPIMGIKEDTKGRLWLACAGGLYQINTKGAVLNITTKGPWK